MDNVPLNFSRHNLWFMINKKFDTTELKKIIDTSIISNIRLIVINDMYRIRRIALDESLHL